MAVLDERDTDIFHRYQRHPAHTQETLGSIFIEARIVIRKPQNLPRYHGQRGHGPWKSARHFLGSSCFPREIHNKSKAKAFTGAHIVYCQGAEIRAANERWIRKGSMGLRPILSFRVASLSETWLFTYPDLKPILENARARNP